MFNSQNLKYSEYCVSHFPFYIEYIFFHFFWFFVSKSVQRIISGLGWDPSKPLSEWARFNHYVSENLSPKNTGCAGTECQLQVGFEELA